MLPSALLELLCHRLSIPYNTVYFQNQARGRIRHFQQLAVHPSYSGHEIPLLKVSRGASGHNSRADRKLRAHQAEKQVQAVYDLEERVAALKEATDVSKLNDPDSHEGPHYQDVELRSFYEDLLSLPDTETVNQNERATQTTAESHHDLLGVLEGRLHVFESALDVKSDENTLSSRLLARMLPTSPLTGGEATQLSKPQEDKISLRTLIYRLRSVLIRLHAETDSSRLTIPPIPLGMLSNTEWGALAQICLDANDVPASEIVLDLMKRSGLHPSNEQYDAVLNWYAAHGCIQEADSFFSRVGIVLERDRQRDLLIKARVKAGRLDEAIEMIHTFETQITPAPMQSYTRAIRALFSQRGPGSERLKAQAWDMFSHMRYVAHPTADGHLYSVMIRACAESADPEPERALDLFTEMTVDNKITPTTHTYNAVILTCARSKNFALEAFRLAREMLNSYRDAYGNIPTSLRPDNATFRALLEAAKRLGDLPRARWILAQMMHEARNSQVGGQDIYVDERIMTHIFHVYASYRPPFRREAVDTAPEETADARHKIQGKEAPSPLLRHDLNIADAPQRPGVPQSRQEIIREVSALWERILEAQRHVATHTQDDASPHQIAFGRLSLTSQLINAYMAVHYAHSPPSAAYNLYKTVFDDVGVSRDAHTYVLALDAYAQRRDLPDRELQFTLSVARGIWKDWRRLEDSGVTQVRATATDPIGVNARLVEKAWSAMMRLLASNGHLSEALDFLHQFVRRYPPGEVKRPSPPDPKRSTRTSLYGERPIVRLTERSTVPEDRVPPFLTFRDLSLLHHRAVTAKRTDYITYITWAAKAYEGSLRSRRDATLRPPAASKVKS